MRRKSCDLVAQLLRADYSDLITYTLVGLEIKCQARVEFLNNHPASLFDCFGADSTLTEGLDLHLIRYNPTESIRIHWDFDASIGLRRIYHVFIC